MPVNQGKEQFHRAIMELRNRYIVALLQPLMTFRQEVVTNDEFKDRGGTDDQTRDHFVALLVNADRWRRRVTSNPDQQDLGDQIEKAIDSSQQIEIGNNPFGGDDIQNASGGMFDLNLYFKLDGTDPNIPVNSQLEFKNGNGMILLGAIDEAIVGITRCNSRDRSKFITTFDSMRIYGQYQAILGYIVSFMGRENRVDVAQVLPSDEPNGPTDSPNLQSETGERNPG